MQECPVCEAYRDERVGLYCPKHDTSLKEMYDFQKEFERTDQLMKVLEQAVQMLKEQVNEMKMIMKDLEDYGKL